MEHGSYFGRTLQPLLRHLILVQDNEKEEADRRSGEPPTRGSRDRSDGSGATEVGGGGDTPVPLEPHWNYPKGAPMEKPHPTLD